MLRAKAYSYLDDDGNEHKKSKDYNLKAIIMMCIQKKQIALSSNDDKWLQTFDGIKTYPYGTKLLKYVKMKC